MTKQKNTINILFIGDIVGRSGRNAVGHFLPQVCIEEDIDLVFANGENMAHGSGMTLEKYEEVLRYGVDYFTSGNHIFTKREFLDCLDNPNIKVLRPANYLPEKPGRGVAEIVHNGTKIILVNLIGRVFMNDREPVDDPFTTGLEIAQNHRDEIIIVDFHAEATSEKAALVNYLDGKITALVGTHTHVQTADERILPGGTAFITDIGMCGPLDSIIGIKKEIIIEKFLTGINVSHKVASGDSIFNAVVLSIDLEQKSVVEVKRVSRVYKLS